MKKILLIFSFLLLGVMIFGQSPTENKGGIKVGPKNATDLATIKKMLDVSNDLIIIDENGDTLKTYIPASGYESLFTVAPKLYSDTVAISAGRTLVLTDANKRIYCTFAARDTIFIPLEATVAWVKETTIVFSMEGAGPLFFKGVAGVSIDAPLDSLNLNTTLDMAALIYRGGDNWRLIGTKE